MGLVKHLTVVVRPNDERTSEITQYVAAKFPDVETLNFRPDEKIFTPRAVRLIGASNDLELIAINAALWKEFFWSDSRREG
jgi:hypothetical protein